MVSRDPPTSLNPSIFDVFFATLCLIGGICWFQFEILPRNQVDVLQTFKKSDFAQNVLFFE